MTDDLVRRLRSLGSAGPGRISFLASEDAMKAADRIEKLVEENGVLFAANVRLNSRADLDSDGYVDRIKNLEVALREIVGVLDDPKGGQHVYDMRNASYIARKALEGKDD